MPEPFTIDEMAAILAWFKKAEPFYFAFVLWQFETGARPSESTALRFADVQWNRIRIHRSRHLKTEAATKTKNSQRIITVGPTLAALLTEQRLPFFSRSGSPCFTTNTAAPSTPINGRKITGRWSNKNSASRTGESSTRPATRSSPSRSRRNRNIKAIADYCGTSIQMIEQDYCAQ